MVPKGPTGPEWVGLEGQAARKTRPHRATDEAYMAKKNPLQIEIYEAKDGYRWRMWRSGRIVAESGEAYVKKAQCKRTLIRLSMALASEDYIWKP